MPHTFTDTLKLFFSFNRYYTGKDRSKRNKEKKNKSVSVKQRKHKLKSNAVSSNILRNFIVIYRIYCDYFGIADFTFLNTITTVYNP